MASVKPKLLFGKLNATCTKAFESRGCLVRFPDELLR